MSEARASGESGSAERSEPAPDARRAAEAGLAPELVIVRAENLEYLRGLADGGFDLVYIDPPFHTGRVQRRTRLRTVRDEQGDRVGFGGKRYRTEELSSMAFDDRAEDYLAFLGARLEQAHRLLEPEGSLFLHLDPRESHYAKVLLDGIFGRDSFQNEIVWAYDYGARTRSRWPAKHDVILWYTRHPTRFTFEYDEVDRVPYLAPSLVGDEKAKRGKTPTDVWWHTIVSPTGRERTGYPTQKPLGILERIVRVHSRPGDRVLDFFAGSGTTGEAAVRHGRSCVLVDESEEACEVMKRRLAFARPRVVGAAAGAGESVPGSSRSGRPARGGEADSGGRPVEDDLPWPTG